MHFFPPPERISHNLHFCNNVIYFLVKFPFLFFYNITFLYFYIIMGKSQCTFYEIRPLVWDTLLRYPFDFHTQGPFLFHIVSFHTKSYERFYFHTMESSISILLWSQPFHFYTNSRVTTLTKTLSGISIACYANIRES